MTATTIIDLQRVIEPHFAAARTVLQRLREGSLLPPGLPGRGGSAAISARQAVLVLLALSSLAWSEPFKSPTAALRLAGFRLHRHGRDPIPLIDVMAGEIVSLGRGAANFEAVSWCIGEVTAVRAGEPRLRFLAGDLPTNTLLANRQTLLDGELIVAVAKLFRPSDAELEIAAEVGWR